MRGLYLAFFQIPGLPDWLMGHNNFTVIIKMLKASGKPNTFSAENLDEYRRAYTNAGGLTGMINWYRAIARFRPSMPRGVRLQMPVRILWGKNNLALSAEMAQDNLKYCANGELFYLENATHWVQHDEVEEINKYLIDFFK